MERHGNIRRPVAERATSSSLNCFESDIGSVNRMLDRMRLLLGRAHCWNDAERQGGRNPASESS